MPTALSDRGLKGCRSGGKTNAPPRRAFEGMRVGKGRAGHWSVRHVPCSFSLSPLSPPAGEFPPATPSGGSRGRARAFLCSSPVTAPAFSLPHSGKGGAGPFRCPRARHLPCFSSRGVFFSRPQVFSIPARLAPPVRSRDLRGRRRCCSRRGRAAASLPAGLVHRLPRSSPPPSLAAAIVRRVRAALRPSGRLASAPVRP